MKSMKGRYRLVTSFLVRTPPSKHASRATSWESSGCHHFGKQVSHMEPDSASMTAWSWMRVSPQDLRVNQLEVSILIVPTHFLVGLQYHNKAVIQSGRRDLERRTHDKA
jgi:hypothetical protein